MVALLLTDAGEDAFHPAELVFLLTSITIGTERAKLTHSGAI